MTSITVQDGEIVLRDGAIGTEQACCCALCQCNGILSVSPLSDVFATVKLTISENNNCPEGEHEETFQLFPVGVGTVWEATKNFDFFGVAMSFYAAIRCLDEPPLFWPEPVDQNYGGFLTQASFLTRATNEISFNCAYGGGFYVGLDAFSFDQANTQGGECKAPAMTGTETFEEVTIFFSVVIQ